MRRICVLSGAAGYHFAQVPEPSTPFQRLLTDAQQGGQAKVDALMALSQRTVLVPTWGQDDGSNFRTLTNANGQTALPVFSRKDELERASTQFGWSNADGSTSSKEVGARAAFNYAVAHNLHFVVVDIGAPHSLDVDREEIEPLLTPAARRESSGPYAGVGRISSSMMRAVKPASSPGQVPAVDAARRPDPTAMAREAAAAGASVSASTTDDPIAVTTFGSGSSVAVHKLSDVPSDDLLAALAGVLRGYPEVEWAALCAIARGPGGPMPTAALKVDMAFRQRVNEIVQRLRESGDAQGASLDVLLLDDPKVMRTVRSEALLFYPWKR